MSLPTLGKERRNEKYISGNFPLKLTMLVTFDKVSLILLPVTRSAQHQLSLISWPGFISSSFYNLDHLPPSLLYVSLSMSSSASLSFHRILFDRLKLASQFATTASLQLSFRQSMSPQKLKSSMSPTWFLKSSKNQCHRISFLKSSMSHSVCLTT